MERLVERRYLADGFYMKCSENCDVDIDCVDCPVFDKLVDRLGAYEDTGLMPAELVELMNELEEFTELKIFDEIMDYLEAKKDGRVLVLPCKVGDTVYEGQTIRKRIQSLEITAVHIGRTGEPFFYWELKNGVGIYNNVRGFGVSQLGKTVFLTHEEAEAALIAERSPES